MPEYDVEINMNAILITEAENIKELKEMVDRQYLEDEMNNAMIVTDFKITGCSKIE